jgi:hypothetical protein
MTQVGHQKLAVFATWVETLAYTSLTISVLPDDNTPDLAGHRNLGFFAVIQLRRSL